MVQYTCLIRYNTRRNDLVPVWKTQMLHEILIGLSLMFVIEGVVLAVGSDAFKKAMLQIVQLPSSNIRIIGVSSMLLGLVMLLIIK